MTVFKDMLGSGESLFRNDVALDFDYMPKAIKFRENEQRQIASCMKPLFSQRNARNAVVFGAPGVGKTLACNHLIEEIEEESDEIFTIYVNCWKNDSSYKIFVEICHLLGYRFTQNKKTEELFAEIKRIVNKKSAVFVFDEIDRAKDYDFLYSILEDIYRKTVILVTNFKNWIVSLDPRIKSRLMPETIEFLPYNPDETRGILKERMEYAFVPDIWEHDAFSVIVGKTVETGDIRRGLYLMKESANCAEDASSRKVRLDHVKKAMEKIQDFSVNSKDELEDDVKKLLDLIRENSGKKSGDLFRAYEEAGGQNNYKWFQRKVARLRQGRYITTEKITGGPEGTTTIVKYSGETKKLTEF
ncbi:AAA family ATPase [Candidatus Woesearchaeota archaeon]|nr:AAA family ATPase [Candidatus Woesearchaeota archaeon]